MPKVTNVELWCPHCAQRLLTPINQRGHQISCQGCGSIIVVPLNARVAAMPMSYPVKLGLIFLGLACCIWVMNTFSDSSEDTSKQESLVDYSSVSPKQVSSASPEQVKRISSALGESYTVHECRVIPSNGEYQGYWVGARFTSDGEDEKSARIGIWFMFGPKGNPQGFYSVNQVAYQASRMGLAEPTKLGYSMANQEAMELLKALTK